MGCDVSDRLYTSEYASATENRLWPQHVALLQARAITPEYAEKVGLCSVDLQKVKEQVDKFAKFGVRGPWARLPLHAITGLLIPYPSCADGIPRYRVRSDRTEYSIPGPIEGSHHGETTQQVPRYICQSGVPVAPYITPEARSAAANVDIPLFITEAPLKSCSLSCNGFPAIGMGGVLAGAHDPDVLRDNEEIVASRDLKRINWRGRRAYIVYDAFLDRNPMVALGAAYAAIALEREGADVWVVRLPTYHATESDPEAGQLWSETDQGPDDYLARCGVEHFRELVEAAVPANPAKRIVHETRTINRRAARADVVGQLLNELLFQAMLSKGGDLAVDLAAGVGRSSDVSRKSFAKAAASFGEALVRKQTEEEPDWKSELRTTVSGIVKPVAFNVEITLRHDSMLAGLAAYDEFKQCVVFRKEPPWTAEYPDSKNTKAGDPWSDADDTRLAGYLTRTHDIVDLPEKKIQAALTVVGMDHRYHPVREYLRSLVWDGIPRLDTAAEMYLRADPELNRYHRIVLPKWLISAVARVERPGEQVDHAIVLEGRQGDAKTSALRVLGGEWYSDASQDDLQDKESAMKLQGSWIFVFDEGAILTRADARALKDFLSKVEDQIIPKYSNRKILLKRQCVFALTTNDQQYLTDPTGNRRYWPIACGEIDIEALRRDRDQLWAEAYARFVAGEQFWPTEEEKAIIRPEQDSRRRADTWESQIEEGIISRGLTEVTVEDILTEILEIKNKDASHGDRIRVVNALTALGWQQDKPRKINGITRRVYVRRDAKVVDGELRPSHPLTPAQEAALQTMMAAISGRMTLERLPNGRIIRVWREAEPTDDGTDVSALVAMV
ncbi:MULTISPECIES: VapE domain-containing protein [Sorangium]|uniref:Uncharacterized protein n=1 Tax=Sorangium cellulosum TaxID=56 RepID=A0A4P2QP84_SORCE|nr:MULTISPECIES: VapE domain-containing protein [Sorangium]AUX31949.1 uncharacterized protein SOCE836_040840 [Sorangium cellulosum]WCQ91323.1 DNA helicase [Sorangium sp. Soce836]